MRDFRKMVLFAVLDILLQYASARRPARVSALERAQHFSRRAMKTV
jgi:hypothetical protein